METEKLLSFITGNIEKEEDAEVMGWINSTAENKEEFIRLKNLMALSSFGKQTLDIENEYYSLNKKLKSKSRGRIKLIKLYSRYAAILIIAIVFGFAISELRFIIFTKTGEGTFHEFYSPEGQISEFTLTDGTRIWLNSDTRIKIPIDFNSRNRKIMLDGEAFFEVKKDKSHHFIIETQNILVKVFGTTFNLSSYKSDSFIETTLTEGKIGLKTTNNKKIAMLNPGQQIIYNKITGESTKLTVDTSPFESWRNGKMIFKDRSLEYIANKLNRWYSVEINFQDSDIKNLRFTGTILKNKPLGQVLEVISLSAPIGFTIKINNDKKNQVKLYSLKTNKNMK